LLSLNVLKPQLSPFQWLVFAIQFFGSKRKSERAASGMRAREQEKGIEEKTEEKD
jgi:hypothetical protein